jgi:hypothetical protein
MPRDGNGDWYEPGWCPKCGLPEDQSGKCLGLCGSDGSAPDEERDDDQDLGDDEEDLDDAEDLDDDDEDLDDDDEDLDDDDEDLDDDDEDLDDDDEDIEDDLDDEGTIDVEGMIYVP